MSEIGPDDKVVILSGTGVLSEAGLDAFFAPLFERGYRLKPDERSAGVKPDPGRRPAQPTNPERDAWNAAVDAKKAAKKARKASKC